MITPSGKHRSQVNQGGLKNQSIWDSSWFHGVAGEMTKEAIAATAPNAPVAEPMEESMTEDSGMGMGNDLNRAMSDGNSMRMNPNKIPQDGEIKQPGAGGNRQIPPDARFDPYSGEPLMGVDGTKLVVMLNKWLGSNQETADLDIVGFTEKGGQYTVTFGPKGKQVTKGV
jgi:hypothetical protein